MTQTISNLNLDASDSPYVLVGERNDPHLWLEYRTPEDYAGYTGSNSQPIGWTINDGGWAIPFGTDEDMDDAREQWLAVTNPLRDEPLR